MMSRWKKHESPQVVLPSYTLDSNLVLLPGIIYNVTFSRFKAAALLYRFKEQVENVSIINNLLGEYDFNNESSSEEGNPSVISAEAVDGISYLFKNEFKLKIKKPNADSPHKFDWLTFAIEPNPSKIREPVKSDSASRVVTIVRVVGIIDDTTNIKLTLQAITRGLHVESAASSNKIKKNEALLEVDWDYHVDHLKDTFKQLRDNSYQLFDCIDEFVVEYRKALNASAANAAESKSDTGGDLLTLNPLANALYLQLVGSKDFSKAYNSLQQLYGQFSTAPSTAAEAKIQNQSFLRLVDITAAILPFPNHEKHKLLNQFETTKRIEKINAMLSELVSIFENLKENNAFVNHWFHNEASNLQRATVVANQLKSMRVVLEGMTKKPVKRVNNKQLVRRKNDPQPQTASAGPIENDEEEDDEEEDDDDDELGAITNFIKNRLPRITSLSADSKRLLVKDFKRIKSSSSPGSGGGGGGSDFQVIRNYLEIVMDIPWENYATKFKSNKEIDLAMAKAQLDEDHYGLEHVKNRLIQYLVVLKLLGTNAEKDFEVAQKRIDEAEAAEKLKEPSKVAAEGAIVIANNDETSSSHRQARSKAKDTYNGTTARNKLVADAAVQASKTNKSPIILLAGPPGTGKTSLAKSIATSLGRDFQRISLGGVKDESEIRGHRRTYVGAMPGLLIQALRKARSMNPVILLDEIDKVVGGSSSGASKYNGDPSAALLEVLDPEQNSTFIDHYLGFPVDLSQVIFICTANEPQELSRPLLDRMEMITVGAYDYNEKLIIGKKYLLPRQVKRNGFPMADKNVVPFVNIDDSVMKKIIVDYTQEAGVRNFERKLGTVCRFKAVEYCESLESSSHYDSKVEEADLSKYLGVPYSSGDFTAAETTISNSSRIGIVNGLSYNSEGSGSVLVFESIGFDKRIGNPDNVNSGCTLNMTGRLGEVLSESAKIALIFIKSLVYKGLLSLKEKDAKDLVDTFSNLDINMHVPSGSISKDGPSAGITMALSFLSLILEKPVPHDIAMTGEITLRGLVLPIGGVKEKMMGAHLNGGIKRMIVPRENRKDLIEEYSRSIEEAGPVDSHLVNELLRDNEDVDFKMTQVEEFYVNKYGIQIYYAREFYDVMKVVWGDEEVMLKLESRRMVEYHL